MANATQRAIRRANARQRDALALQTLQNEVNRLRRENAAMRETRSYALSDAAIRRASVDSIGYRSTASGTTAQSPDTRRPQYRTDSIGTGQGVFHSGASSVDALFAASIDVQS